LLVTYYRLALYIYIIKRKSSTKTAVIL